MLTVQCKQRKKLKKFDIYLLYIHTDMHILYLYIYKCIYIYIYWILNSLYYTIYVHAYLTELSVIDVDNNNEKPKDNFKTLYTQPQISLSSPDPTRKYSNFQNQPTVR